MMLTPTKHELRHLYDPVQAHEYYLRTRELKGRRRRTEQNETRQRERGSSQDPRTGLTREQISENAKAKQRRLLTASIATLTKRVHMLEALIREKEHKADSEDRKSKAKKERAAKEKDKPKSAAEKAESARESKKYREKHKQELKTKAKQASDKSGGGGSSKKGSEKKTFKSVNEGLKLSELKAKVTRYKGQIAVAKQKLAAL